MARPKNSAAQRYSEKLELKQKKLEAGTLSERFPQVAGIVVYMTYYQNLANPVLMSRTVNFFPSSPAYFHMKCAIKECEDGGFDLASAISSLVRRKKTEGKGKMFCGGRGDGLSSRHASIDYEIKVRYRKSA
ncbi:MAG: hypothetical protein Kow0025_16230 [Thermodesulfovibrionales bacterium]